MIIGQIIHWIVKNKEVYFSKHQSAYQQPEFIKQSITKIVQELARCIPSLLRSDKNSEIKNFMCFFTGKDQNGLTKPGYQPHANLIASIPTHKFSMANKIKCSEDIQKLVGSVLLMQVQIVATLLNTFVKAIRDIIANGEAICLNLQFCLIKIQKKSISCVFSKSFKQSLNSKQRQFNNQAMLLQLCPTTKCHKKDKQNVTKAYLRLYQQKQRQIEEGSVYCVANLRQIKNLYDRGRALQMKYKNLFD